MGAVEAGLIGLGALLSGKPAPKKTRARPVLTTVAVTAVGNSGATTAERLAKEACRKAGFTEAQCAEILDAISDPSKMAEYLSKLAVEGAGKACEAYLGEGSGEVCEAVAQWVIDRYVEIYCLFRPSRIRDPWQKPGLIRFANSVASLKGGEIFMPRSETLALEGITWGKLGDVGFSPSQIPAGKGIAVKCQVIQQGRTFDIPVAKTYLNWIPKDRTSGIFRSFTGRERGTNKLVQTLNLGETLLRTAAQDGNLKNVRRDPRNARRIIITNAGYERASKKGRFYKAGFHTGC